MAGSSPFASVGEMMISMVEPVVLLFLVRLLARAARDFFKDVDVFAPKIEIFFDPHGPWDSHGDILSSSGAKSLPKFFTNS